MFFHWPDHLAREQTRGQRLLAWPWFQIGPAGTSKALIAALQLQTDIRPWIVVFQRPVQRVVEAILGQIFIA